MLSKGAVSISGPLEGNGLELCRDLNGFMLRLSMEKPTVVGIDHADEDEQETNKDSRDDR